MEKFILIALTLLGLAACCMAGIPVKPKQLRPGDTVGFVSPGSTVHAAFSNIEAYKTHVVNAMSALGLNVLFSPNSFVNGPSGLAGNDTQRAEDIMWAFSHPIIKGVIANRGGWGCNRIIDMLDYNIIRQNPKAFMGYSDITGCLMAITSQTDLVTFHGPVGTNTWGNRNSDYMKRVLIDGSPDLLFANPSNYPITTIVPGRARGRLIGGNLSVFVALLGSIYIPSLDEPFILFLEDIGENPYRVDRMLTTLHTAGYFKNAQGLIWGTCSNCNPDAPGRWTVLEILQQKWGGLTIPSYSGAFIGHQGEQFTLPLGTQVEMDSVAGTIQLLEAGVNSTMALK
jgi:muramoyltetrapeptide carboxypeptidase